MRLLLAIVALCPVVGIAKTPAPLVDQVRSLIGQQLSSSLPIVAKINEVDQDGLSALHHAAIFGDLPLVLFLLANGADPKLKDQHKRYPLDHVVGIAEKDLSCQQMLIASHLTEAICGIGLDKGDHLSGRSGRYYPALTWAMLAEDQARIEQLLDAGADPRLASLRRYPNNKDPQKNAFEASLSVNNQQLIAIMKDNLGNSFVPLIHKRMRVAIHDNDHKMLERLFALVDAEDFFVSELLILAVDVGVSASVIDTLVANGAKVNVRNSRGNTPLLIAARGRRSTTIEALIKHGAEVNDVDANGTPAMLVAAGAKSIVGGLYSIEVFLKHGVDVDSRDADGNTIASYGAARGEPALVRLAIKYGADVNVSYVDRYLGGNTKPLLFWAIYYGDLVSELLEAGADPNVYFEAKATGYITEGYTPLMVAVYYRRLKEVSSLLDSGADSSLTNNKGQTALEMALEKLTEERASFGANDGVKKEKKQAQEEILVEIISLLME